MTAKELATQAVERLEEKKATDTRILDVRELSTLADYFIISSAGNFTLVKALADELDDFFAKQGREPKSIERDTGNNWILLDYGDVIIHIFYNETRKFYDLERHWGDAPSYSAEEFAKKE